MRCLGVATQPRPGSVLFPGRLRLKGAGRGRISVRAIAAVALSAPSADFPNGCASVGGASGGSPDPGRIRDDDAQCGAATVACRSNGGGRGGVVGGRWTHFGASHSAPFGYDAWNCNIQSHLRLTGLDTPPLGPPSGCTQPMAKATRNNIGNIYALPKLPTIPTFRLVIFLRDAYF